MLRASGLVERRSGTVHGKSGRCHRGNGERQARLTGPGRSSKEILSQFFPLAGNAPVVVTEEIDKAEFVGKVIDCGKVAINGDALSFGRPGRYASASGCPAGPPIHDFLEVVDLGVA